MCNIGTCPVPTAAATTKCERDLAVMTLKCYCSLLAWIAWLGHWICD